MQVTSSVPVMMRLPSTTRRSSAVTALSLAVTEKVTVGDPLQREVFMGPVIEQRSVDKFKQAVAEARLDAVLARLRERRAQRRVPVGTQVLAGWNGLMPSALAEAATSLDGGDTAGVHGRAAAALERYLLESMLVDGRLVRLRTGSGAPVPADLEDYAYVIAGLQNWQAARDAGTDAPVTVLLRQAWQRFHADGRWRLGEDALLRWDSGAELLADGPLPAPPAVLLAASRRAGLRDVPVRGALDALLPWVARQPLDYASYVGVMP